MCNGSNIIEASEEEPSKILSPRGLIVYGSVTEVKAWHSINEESPRFVLINDILTLVRVH